MPLITTPQRLSITQTLSIESGALWALALPASIGSIPGCSSLLPLGSSQVTPLLTGQFFHVSMPAYVLCGVYLARLTA